MLQQKKRIIYGQKLQLNKETLFSTILQLKYKHFVTENSYATEKTFLVQFFYIFFLIQLCT